MKTKVLLSAIATIALLLPSTAMASNHKHRHEAKPKARIEHSKLIIINRERMWTADGVLYRMIPSRRGTVYVVIGYLK